MFSRAGGDFSRQIFAVSQFGHLGLGVRRFAGVLRIDRSEACTSFPELFAELD